MKGYRHLSQKERFKLYDACQMGLSRKEIAQNLGRSQSTISRELKRNKIGNHYLPDTAQKLYQSRYPGRPRRINPDTHLYFYIRSKLATINAVIDESLQFLQVSFTHLKRFSSSTVRPVTS